MKALFIHRSVGHNLIVEGKLREHLQVSGVELDDYDNNNATLTASDNSVIANLPAIPGNNTNPDNLAQYFTSWDKRLEDYDLIIIKSCYPNSRIKNEAQLASIQQSYQDIFEAFHSRQKRVALLTSPPLRPLFTNKLEAELVSRLNEWLLAKADEYVHVLDFHGLLAESKGQHEGMLRGDYRRLLPFDNHPNKKANKELAPLVAKFIISSQ